MPFPDPKVNRDGDEWIYTWPGAEGELANIVVGIENLHEDSHDIYAEVSVEYVSDISQGHVYGPRRFNLLGARTGSELTRELTERSAGRVEKDVWSAIVEKILHLTISDYRAGTPIHVIADQPTVGPVTYTVERLLPEDDTAVIAADGGAGKGWLAIHIALCYATGRAVAGILPVYQQGRPAVLYLDWEASLHEATRRFQWMAKGMRLPSIPKTIHYRRMTRGISEEINQLRRDTKNLGVGLVIVDSLGPAVADKLVNEGPAIKTMEDIRRLSPAARLVVAHVSKAEARSDNGKGVTIFGSVFFRNLCRSLWELQSEGEGCHYDLALLHQKVNTGLKQPSLGLTLTFNEEDYEALIGPGHVENVAQAVQHSSLAYRMALSLKEGKMKTSELAKELGAKPSSIRTTAARNQNIIRLPTASNQEAEWALRAEEDS